MQTVYPVNPILDISDNIQNKEVEKYASVKCIKKNSELQTDHVCFHYALSDIEKKEKRRLWNCADGYYILKEYFKQISIEEAKQGDIITYHEINDYKNEYEKPCAGNCVHFAIISETDGRIKNVIIKSKWGMDGVFKGKLDDVPNDYGTAITIWRKL